jgi:hypothetical protein
MMSISFNDPSHNQDTTESTFLYQVEAENVSSVLSDSFLALNELKDPNYLSLPTPSGNSTFKIESPFNHSDKIRPTNMEKIANGSTYSGYSNDNAKKFLSEFMSYTLLHDLHDYNGKKVAAFHLHLKGPALTWFNALSDFSKQKWKSVQVLFEEKFINFANNNAMAMMEG